MADTTCYATIMWAGSEVPCNSSHEPGGSEDARMGWHRHHTADGTDPVLSWAKGSAWLEALNRAQVGFSEREGTVVVREHYAVVFRPSRDDAELVVPEGASAARVVVRGPFRAEWFRNLAQPLGAGGKVRLGREYQVTGPNEDDWTLGQDGRSNSSPQFNALCDEVERLIRGQAWALIRGDAGAVAGLVMAQLAHVHGLRPPPFHGVPYTHDLAGQHRFAKAVHELLREIDRCANSLTDAEIVAAFRSDGSGTSRMAHLCGRVLAAAGPLDPEPAPDERHVCPKCGSDRWVSVSRDEGYTRVAQCVPCGAFGDDLGPGWRAR